MIGVMKNSWYWVIVAMIVGVFGLMSACGNDDDSGSTDSSDTDTDSDSDDDTGSDTTGLNVCDYYPEADNNFDEGSIIRNYQFYDKEDNVIEVCEWADWNNQLLLIKLNTDG